MNPPREVMVVGKALEVELTVRREHKSKNQKHTSSNSKSVHKIEKKGSSNGKTEQNWRDNLGKQTVISIKEAQSRKNKDIKLPKSNVNIKNHRKHKNLEDCSKQCCSTSVLVHDRAIQYPDNNNRFDEFSPHILSSLVGGLKIKKDEACNIATEMEKILSKKSIDSEKPPEIIETKLETRAQSKEQYIKNLKTMSEKWGAEKEELQRIIGKQDAQLKEINKEKADLKNDARKLIQQLEEAKHITEDKSKTIEQQTEKIKTLEQQIENQKSILDSKLQLLQENLITIQYLTAERDQYIELFRYQDERIAKYQNTMKELQNQIVAMANLNDGNASPQTSAIHTPRAFSSPTSSFSGCSDKSWPDLSDIPSAKQVIQGKTVQMNVAPLDVSLLDEESSHSTIDSC